MWRTAPPDGNAVPVGLQRLLLVVARQNRDDAGHRCSEVARAVLDPAVGSGRDRLVELVEVRVEAAVIHERAGVVEAQLEAAAVCADELVRAGVARGVEWVV